MSIFGKEKTKRHIPHTKDPDRMEKLIAVKEKQVDSLRKIRAGDRAAEIVKGDPDAERAYISTLIGVELKAPDPDGKTKQALKTLLTEEALREIQADPALRKELARRQVDAILGEDTNRGDRFNEGEYGGGGSSISQALAEIDELEELRAKLGGKGNGGLLSAFADPEVLKALLGFLAGMRTPAGDEVRPEPYYVISIDGKPTSISKSQYTKLLQEGNLKPVAAYISTKPDVETAGKIDDDGISVVSPTSGIPTKSKEPKEYKDLPEFLNRADFSIANDWLDLEAAEFVTLLKAEVDKQVEESKLIWGFLTTATYEGIVNITAPYKTNPKVSVLIERLLSDEGKEWLEQVLQLVKEASSGNQ